MATQSALKFAMRLSTVFEAPKSTSDGFMEAIADACDGFSSEVYDRAFIKLRDNRKYRTLPMPAEARAICDDQNEVVVAVAKTSRTSQQTTANGEWSPEYAFEHCRRTAIAETAARQGWIGPLISFVRQHHRLPDQGEVSQCQAVQRAFEDALVSSISAHPASLQDIGRAMAAKQSAWAAAVLSADQGQAAA